jgi:DNA-binding transcriptional MocR family regulator
MSAMLDSFDDISKSAPEPIYRQIKQLIEQRIASGEWIAGQKLPSENDLVAALDVSRMTINRALRELTQPDRAAGHRARNRTGWRSPPLQSAEPGIGLRRSRGHRTDAGSGRCASLSLARGALPG